MSIEMNKEFIMAGVTFNDGHKRCSCCKEIKPYSSFYKNKAKKDNISTECKQCSNLISSKRREIKSKETAEYLKEYQSKNKEKLKEYIKQWQLDNKAKVNKNNSRYRARKEKATAVWADEHKIQYYYNLAAFFTGLSGGFVKYHVDHVIPLKGKNVCGLHVHNNLQLLKASENIRKKNKYDCNI